MKQLLRVARLVVISAQHLSRHRLAEPPATSHTAITTLGIECHIYKWYQRRLVNILAIHNVAECIIAFIDIYIPIIVSLVAGKISPHPIAKIRKIVQNNKYIRIFLAYTIKKLILR